jgi:hypothetical protein
LKIVGKRVEFKKGNKKISKNKLKEEGKERKKWSQFYKRNCVLKIPI